jgi:hypothetical protein
MRTFQPLALAACVAALGLFAVAAATDDKKDAPKDGGLVSPRPGPEHEVLKQAEGVWNCTSEMRATPDSPPTTSKGVATCTMGCGGLWLIEDFKGDPSGQPFHGHGITGYDSLRKKFVGDWVDGMMTHLFHFEGTYDAGKKTLTLWTESPDASGKLEKWRAVTEFQDRDTRLWSAYFTAPDGREFVSLKITYKRKM